MSTIVTRAGKGSPLTNNEMDANLNNLNNDKIESNTGTSVDGELVLFNSTTGKSIKRAATTGLLKAASGVLSAASAGTDYAAPNVEQTWTAQQTPKNGSLTDGANIDWNGASNGQVVTVTLAGNRTMNAPTNIKQYALYMLRVTQDGTGSRTLAWNAAYKFGGSGAPTLTTTASKTDILSFVGGSGNTLEYLGSRLNAV